MSSSLQPLLALQPLILFPGNQTPIKISLIDGATYGQPVPTPAPDVTGTMTVYDPSGNVVPGASAVSGTPISPTGTYQFMIDGSLFNPTPGRNYTAVFALNSNSIGGPNKWTVPVIIRERTTP